MATPTWAHALRVSGLAILVLVALSVQPPRAAGFDYRSYQPYESRIAPAHRTIAAGVWDHYAVLVDEAQLIRVYDVADPLAPVLVDEVPFYTEYGFDVLLCGRYVFVTGWYENQATAFRVLDSGHLSRRFGGQFQEPGGHYFNAAGVATDGDLVFVAGTRWPGVYPNLFAYRDYGEFYGLLPITWPSLGPALPLAVTMREHRLFVASATTGLAWFDFSPAGTVAAADTLVAGRGCLALAADGGVLVGAEGDGDLTVVKTSGGAPEVAATVACGGTSVALAVRGDELLLADTGLGIRRLSLAETRHPTARDTFLTGCGARGVAFQGRYLVASSPGGGLMFIDPERPHANPVRGAAPWITSSFAAWGTMVCGLGQVDGQDCLALVDLADPAAARLVDTMPFAWRRAKAPIVAMSDSLVLVGPHHMDALYEVHLVSWNPAAGFTVDAPVSLMPMLATHFDVRGTQVYLIAPYAGMSRLLIRDAHDLRHVVNLQTLMLAGTPRGLRWFGQSLWCAGDQDASSFFYGVDVAAPGHAFVRTASRLPGWLQGLDVQTDMIAAIRADGVQLLDASRPNDLQPLAEIPVAGVTGCVLRGNTAYLRTEQDLQAYALADPRQPVPLGTVCGAMPCVKSAAPGLLIGGSGGLLVFAPQAEAATAPPVAPPTAVAGPVLRLEPNPFNPRLAIRLTVPGPGPVTGGIYDVRGRRVRELRGAASAAGDFEAAWDGRDATGAEAPSGAYLVRLTTAGGVVTRKATLVR